MKVLICPLNWGLGHATRCIPIIEKHLSEGHEVYIASDGHPLKLLKDIFPKATYILFPSYNIKYSRGTNQIGAMLLSLPKILKGILQERIWIKKIVKEKGIELIISDNRFGLWHKTIPSIYITHQLMIKMPKTLKFAEPIVWLSHRFFINKYSRCFIPDLEGSVNLSGDLAHKYPYPKNAEFIGVLSRFANFKSIEPDKSFHIIALISGPEPQRSIFEKKIYNQFKSSTEKVLMLRGLPDEKNLPEFYIPGGNITLINHLESAVLASLIMGCQKIICRSGYTSIMDLYTLNCLSKTEFYPTPGQTEQEYLKTHLKTLA